MDSPKFFLGLSIYGYDPKIAVNICCGTKAINLIYEKADKLKNIDTFQIVEPKYICYSPITQAFVIHTRSINILKRVWRKKYLMRKKYKNFFNLRNRELGK